MHFYVWDYLGYVRASQTGYAEFRPQGRKTFDGVFPECPECATRIGTISWKAPFSAKITTNKLGDICTDGQDIFLSRKFRSAWANSGLDGLEFVDEPIETTGADCTGVDYKLVRIPHALTRLDEIASGLVVSKVVGCDVCRVAQRERVERLRIDETTWSGLDSFRPSGLYGAAVVTSRFVDFVDEYGLTNFHFIHEDDYKEPKVFDEHSALP